MFGKAAEVLHNYLILQQKQIVTPSSKVETVQIYLTWAAAILWVLKRELQNKKCTIFFLGGGQCWDS